MTEQQRRLAEENVNLVYWFIRKHGLDCDEYEGMLMETLCKASIGFDSEKGMSFSTYAVKAFNNSMKMHWREDLAIHRIPKSLIRYLDEKVNIGTGDGKDVFLYDVVEDKRDRIGESETRMSIEEFLNTLSVRDLIAFRMAMEGNSQKKIAEKIGRSQSQVSRDLKRIMKGIC